MVVVPGVTPYTIPVVWSIVATARLLLLHVPPPVLLPSGVVLPVHTDVLPVIAPGSGVTVMLIVEVHAPAM